MYSRKLYLFDRCNRYGGLWNKKHLKHKLNKTSYITLGLISLLCLVHLNSIDLFNYDKSLCYLSVLPFTFAKEYLKPSIQKDSIFSENRGKSGIYCWVNTISGKFYIGSAMNLSTRLYSYYSTLALKRNSSMLICLALIKYGHSSFSLYILEYCDKKDTIKREQYYFDLLKPSYNILSVAGSPLGKIQTEATKLKISKAMQQLPNGDKHPMFGKILSEEIREKMRAAKLGTNHFGYGKALSDEHKAKIATSQYNTQKISILDLETNIETIYSSMREGAKALNCLVGSIGYNIKNGNKPFRGRYAIKKL